MADQKLFDPSRRFRVAVLNTHPIQYFAPLYRYLNNAGGLEIEALYLSDASLRGGLDKGFGQEISWDIDLLSGYHSRFMGKAAATRSPDGKFFSIVAREVWSVLRMGDFDALWLHGHRHAANILALAAARSIGLPVMMRCETHLRLPRGRFKSTLRPLALRILYSQCDRFLGIGSLNEAFYRSLGIPDSRIFRVPYAVDNERFMQATALSDADRAVQRRLLGVTDDQPIILYASKLQRHKRPQDLIRACQSLEKEGLKFHLVIAGSGELEGHLRSMIAASGPRNAHLMGFVNQAALPNLYAASDLFVLPSDEEPWGLVVNEAMCAGLPIVATTAVGAAHDLIDEGGNGAIYEAGDVRGLASALRPIISDALMRQRMGRRSLRLISNWGYEQCREGLLSALASFPKP